MKEALAKIDKKALAIMADHFNVEAPQSLPKEAIAEKLSSAILATAPEWLKRLPPYDIEILRELSKLPTGTRIEKPRP